MSRLGRPLGVVTLLLLAAKVEADQVWLKNGDRLSGKIQYRERRYLVLSSPALGQSVIKWSAVETFQSDVPLELELRGEGGRTVTTVYQGEPGTILTAGGEVIKLADIVSVIRPGALLEHWQWDGDLDAELELKDDGDTRSRQVTLDLDTSLEQRWWRLRLESEVEYETRNNRTSDDNAQVSFTTDRFITDQWYLRGRLGWKRDKVEYDFSGRVYGLGAGRRVFNDAKRTLDATVELDRLDYRWLVSVEDSVEMPLEVRFEALSIDLRYTERFARLPVDFTAEVGYFHPLSIPVDFIIDSELSLKYRLNSWARLTLKFELDQTSAKGIRNRDTRTLFGLGMDW